jgi:PHD/YefM family antitoxin component YafN of YafNO toxin-antitoxin module
MADMEKISIREFRNNMAHYTSNATPVAVMKHGHTVGYYIPVHREPSAEDRQNLREAAAAFDALLAQHGLQEDEIIAEFQALRRTKEPS